MTNQALIYHRPSKWPIASALSAAVLIHLAAVAIAFYRESPATEPAGAVDFVPFAFEPTDDPALAPEPNLSLTPPPPPTVDFIEAHDIERALTPPDSRACSHAETNGATDSEKWKGLGGECPATRLSLRSAQPPPYRKRYCHY